MATRVSTQNAVTTAAVDTRRRKHFTNTVTTRFVLLPTVESIHNTSVYHSFIFLYAIIFPDIADLSVYCTHYTTVGDTVQVIPTVTTVSSYVKPIERGAVVHGQLKRAARRNRPPLRLTCHLDGRRSPRSQNHSWLRYGSRR